MSKRIRTLIIVFIVVALLVGGLLVVLNLPEDTGDDPSTPSTTATTAAPLIDKANSDKADAVTSVTVTLKDAEPFTVAADADGLKAVTAFAGLPRNATAVDALLSALTTIRPTSAPSENVDDAMLAACGFDTPAATVAVTYADTTTYTFEIGNTVSEQSAAYFREAGKRTVYFVSASFAETVTRAATAYIGTTLVSPPTADAGETGTAQMMSLHLTGSQYSTPLSLRFHEPADKDRLAMLTNYVITAPYYRATNEDVIGSWATSMNTLTATGVAAVFPTAEQKAAFGLATPQAVAALTLGIYSEASAEGEAPTVTHPTTYTLRVGNKAENGAYYVMLDGVDAVYTVAANALPWLGKAYNDIAMPHMFMKYITTVSQLVLTVDGRQTVVQFEHVPDSNDSDTNLIATVNGQTYSTPNTRALYQVLMSLMRLADADGATPEGEPKLIVKLVPTPDGGDEIEVKLYPHSANRYLCVQPDGDTYLVKASLVESTLRQIDNYLAGKEVVF